LFFLDLYGFFINRGDGEMGRFFRPSPFSLLRLEIERTIDFRA
jgi:hypothetical protein